MDKSKYIKLSEYGKQKGIHYNTALNHFQAGKIDGAIQTETGSIYVPRNWDITKEFQEMTCVIYTRVSSSENKKNLDGQLERLRSYALAKGYKIIDEVKEVGSGVNDNRQKLNKLLSRRDYQIIVVEHKDRLTRFGFNYIQTLMEADERKIDVANLKEEKDASLMEDLISVIYYFSARMYGLRRSKRTTEKIIKTLENNK